MVFRTTAKQLVCALFLLGVCARSEAMVSVADYDSLQAAIDANPGRMIFVPEGDYPISEALRITADNTGLYGYGTIVLDNPEASLLRVNEVDGVRIKDITFTRAEDKQEATASGIQFDDCNNLVFDGVRVLNCKSRNPAIGLYTCKDCTIRNCEIINYKRIAIDDRTDAEDQGYAFNAIDGTGIFASHCIGLKVDDNRILEYALMPTREVKEEYSLGILTEGRHPTKLGVLGKKAVGNGNYVNNWHQGSAMVLSRCDNVTVTGNYLENCAQGFDVHGDNTVIANNTVYCGMMGVKLTHGSRNIIVDGNLLRRIDLWAILLNPGTGSNYARDATDDEPAKEANVDGGTIISNNLITEYGFGNEYWNWGGQPKSKGLGSYAIALYEAQLDDEPPLRNLMIEGNLVYNVGNDKIIKDGKAVEEAPRYRYAVYIGPWSEGTKNSLTLPRDILFGDNLFQPGSNGVSNIDLASVAPKD